MPGICPLQPIRTNHCLREKTKKMRKIFVLPVLFFCLMACKSTTVDKKDDLIYYQETIALNEVPRSTLSFFDVSDSRCPEGVNCIWAGFASVDLLLEGASTEGRTSKHLNLCIGECTTGQKKTHKTADTLDYEFTGQKYRFILKTVNRPKSDSTATKKGYSIALDINKL